MSDSTLTVVPTASPRADPPYQEITMPALSPTMTQGNIAEWKIAAGDKVNAGDVIADIETDKATMALESMEDGYVAKILVPAGATDVKVGELVAIMVDEENDCAEFADFTPGASAAPAANPRWISACHWACMGLGAADDGAVERANLRARERRERGRGVVAARAHGHD